jgi:3-phosphoshikimate 1-carboxyvinyltransferase
MHQKFSVFTKNKINKYNKKITVDSDKSISHRAYIIASQCLGVSKIKGLNSGDIRTTINALKKLGIKIIKKDEFDHVYGAGISGFKKFSGVLNFGNSGTSARSFLGILTCFPFPVIVTGDVSLKKRPFKRLTDYLEKIGAIVEHSKNKKYTLPIKIHGTRDWALAQKHLIKVKSAQISSALIYAAIQTRGVTEIIESSETRDHLQRLLKSLKTNIKIKENKGKRITKIRGQTEMKNFSIKVPADPSSACFFVVQTLLAKKSSLLIRNVCINKTRTGFIQILKKMGGKIKLLNKKKYFGEPIADLYIQSSNLKGINVPIKWVTNSIDDLVVIWIACALAKGKSSFSDISELRLKESDRIKKMSELLKKLKIKTNDTKDSLKIYGNPNINLEKTIKISSNLDHRVAMASFVAGQVTGCKILIKDFETVSSSFPNFLKLQKKIGAKYEIK